MIKILFIIISFAFLFNNANAETFSAALKKAYNNNLELNAERESLNISAQELKVSKSSYLPNITLEGSKSQEDTNKLTNRDGTDATITDVDPEVKSIVITQTLLDFGRGAELVVYPELFLSGYPPRDLLLKDSFIEGSRTSLREFSEKTGPTPALIGFPEEIRDSVKVYNSAAWCQNSEIHQVFRKKLLPTYDVFDEKRFFCKAPQHVYLMRKKYRNLIISHLDIADR